MVISKEVEEYLLQKSKEIEKKEWIKFQEINYSNHNVDNINTFALVFKKQRSGDFITNSHEDQYINVVRLVSLDLIKKEMSFPKINWLKL